MSRVFRVTPSDIVVFYDARFPLEDGSDVNRVAVIVDEDGALFVGRSVFGKKIERFSLQAIPTLPRKTVRGSPYPHLSEKIVAYFLASQKSPALFEAGLWALLHNDLRPFETGHLFPPPPSYKNDAEFDKAWAELEARLAPADVIFEVVPFVRTDIPLG